MHEQGGTPITELRSLVEALIERNGQLETALRSRVVIEQAKGVLAERFGLTIEDAFAMLRHSARSARVPIHELAASVVAEPRTPSAIVRGIAREQRWRAAALREQTEARSERAELLRAELEAQADRLRRRRRSGP